MLNNEQIEYILSLRVQYPNLNEQALNQTLSDASWTSAEITEALARYTGDFHDANASATHDATVVKEQRTEGAVLHTAIKTESHIKNTPVTSEVTTTPKQQKSFDNSPAKQVTTQAPIHPATEVKNLSHTRFSFKKGIVSLAVLLLLGAFGAGGYYMTTKSNLLGTQRLTNETIFKTFFSKFAEIKRTHYSFKASVSMNPRDTDAQAFGEVEALTEEELAKFRRDQDRIRDISKIQDALNKARITADQEYTKPYPSSLHIIGGKIKDPLGKAYVYNRAPDGTSYTLVVTFETFDAVLAIQNSAYSFSLSETQKIHGTTITFDDGDFISEDVFDGTPTKPRFFGLFDLSEIERFLPVDFDAVFESSVTVDYEDDKPLYGKFGLLGEITFSDLHLVFDIEALKHEQDYYAIVHKLPTFVGPYSKLKETWIHITESDLNSYGYGAYLSEFVSAKDSEQEEKVKEYREQLPKLIELADTYGLLMLTNKGTLVTLPEGTYTKYTLELVPEKLLPFYEEVITTFASYRNPIIKDDPTVREYLKSPDAQKVLSYLKDNITLVVYFDQEYFPARFEINTRYVPSSESPTLQDVQLDTSLSLTLTEINKPITVTVPENAKAFDDVISEISGKTKQEILIERQQTHILQIRTALDEYYAWTGKYPSFLEDMKTSRKDVPQRMSELENEYVVTNFAYKDPLEAKPFMRIIPDDVYTQTFYGYTSRLNGDDYELNYNIQLPPFGPDVNPQLYYTHDTYNSAYTYEDTLDNEPILVPKFTEGKNVATKNASSQSLLERINSDIDTLSDGLERLIGTDPKKSDTDGDGFNDSEELLGGSNPLGPGRLKGGEEELYF